MKIIRIREATIYLNTSQTMSGLRTTVWPQFLNRIRLIPNPKMAKAIRTTSTATIRILRE